MSLLYCFLFTYIYNKQTTIIDKKILWVVYSNYEKIVQNMNNNNIDKNMKNNNEIKVCDQVEYSKKINIIIIIK